MIMNVSSTVSRRDPVSEALTHVLSRVEPISSGAVADYIPELASAAPSLSAISAASVGGGIYHAGSYAPRFTTQYTFCAPPAFAVRVRLLPAAHFTCVSDTEKVSPDCTGNLSAAYVFALLNKRDRDWVSDHMDEEAAERTKSLPPHGFIEWSEQGWRERPPG